MPSAVITNGAGALLGFRWNETDTVEEVVEINPETGEQVVVGTVGDLEMWSAQIACVTAYDSLYVVGSNAAGVRKIYSLVASTGAFVAGAALSLGGNALDQLLGLAVNTSGALLGFRWNGTNEEMLRVDPATGVSEVLGTVGDLEVWSTVTALNLSNDNLYVIGSNGTEDKLYVMDARTDSAPDERLLYSVPVADYPTTALLVY
jgi:hypothetical protein